MKGFRNMDGREGLQQNAQDNRRRNQSDNTTSASTPSDSSLCSVASEERYPTPFIVDNQGVPRGGIITAQQMIQIMSYYQPSEFDRMLIDCMKKGFDDGFIEEDKNDIIHLQFPQS